MDEPNQPYKGGRLQRAAGATTVHVGSFRQVIVRHGITMGLIASALLLLPSAAIQIQQTTANAFENPLRYLLAAMLLTLFFLYYQRRKGSKFNGRNMLWLGYLLYISVVEELAFRLLLPQAFSAGMMLPAAVILSNAIFAGIHYVTLRWRWQNCLFAFVGGLGFAHLLASHGNLTLVILAHWFFTFLNTPTPPGGYRDRSNH